MPATHPAPAARPIEDGLALRAAPHPAARRRWAVLPVLFHGFTAALLLAALLCITYELSGWWQSGSWRTLTVGELWYGLDPGGLNLLQAVVQRHLSPALWDGPIVALLLRPAWLVFGLPALSVLLLGWLRRRFLPRRS